MKRVSPKELFEGPDKATAYEAVWQHLNPVINDARFKNIYDDAANVLAMRFQEPIHLVALAAGNAIKEHRILEFLPEGSQLTAVGESRNLLERSRGRTLHRDLTHWDQPMRDLDHLDGGHMPRVLTLLGFLPQTPPEDAIPMVLPLLRPEDVLLIGANLAPGKPLDLAHIAPQYDNELTHHWLERSLPNLGPNAKRLVVLAEQPEEGIGFFSFIGQNEHGEPVGEVFRSYRYSPDYLENHFTSYGLLLHEAFITDHVEEGIWLTTSTLSSYSRYHEIRHRFMKPVRRTREIVSLQPEPISDRQLLYTFDVDGQQHRLHVQFPVPIRPDLLEDPLHVMGFACSEAWKIAECIHPDVIRFPWLGGDESFQSFLSKETEYYLQQALYLKTLGWGALPKIALEGDVTSPVMTKVEDKYLMSISGGKESTFALEWLVQAGLPTSAFTLHYDGGPYSGWAARFPYFNRVRGHLTFLETKMWSDRDPGDLFAFAGLRNDPTLTSALSAMGLIAGTYGFRFLVMSNDRSTNEAQAQMDGREVNHQSAKGSAYIEHMNRYYVMMGLPYRYVTMCEHIYSMGAVFGLTQLCGPEIMTDLASCNEVQWIESESLWCGTCPKCCFSIALVEAATSRQVALRTTAGRDLLLDEGLTSTWDSLWAPKATKAFECIGEKAETWHALWLCKQSRLKRNEPLGYLNRIRDPGPIGDYLCVAPPSNLPVPHQEALRQALPALEKR